MTERPTIAIVGATSGIAEACARVWATRGTHDVSLIGRRAEALDRIADDLRVRDPGAAVQVIETPLTDPGAVDNVVSRCGTPAIVLIAFGILPDQARMQEDTKALAEALQINAVAPVLWAEAFARGAAGRQCSIAVLGSVAGDRGRKSNYAYGAAKGLVERYLQGMQHRFARTAVVPVLIKPGPTRTAMTAHMDTAKMASVEDVAARIVAGIDRGRPVIYAPAKWALIMAVIRNLPKVVFDRMDI